MDVALLVWALKAGAAIVGTEVVKEVTKDCYKSLKASVADIFGKRASRRLDELEAAPASVEVESELKAVLGPVSSEESEEIAPKLQALLEALRDDAAAKQVAESVAKIKLDVDAKGHIILDNIQGAQNIDVKASAGKDFVMKNVSMKSGQQSGN